LVNFLANDPAVPARIRVEVDQWRLAKDEFPDTGHWPHQMYISEGRRMLGEFVPFRCLLSKRDQSENLFVTSCISASSVAYASFRLEPGYMIAGHAAGVAAAQAIRTKTPLHRIDVAALQRRLGEQKQILSPPGSKIQ
jgi:hypothetical protein